MISRYPAPIVNTSYWLRYCCPVDGSTVLLLFGKSLVAVFMRRTLTWSGLRYGSFFKSRAAAPLTTAADMLVPLSWRYFPPGPMLTALDGAARYSVESGL